MRSELPNPHGLRTTTIVGYTYNADLYCAPCTRAAWNPTAETAEQALDRVAHRLGITRYDETSFDSGEFPKVLFADQAADDDHCATCHEQLLEQ